MLPVCVKCGREMRCAKNEVVVYHPFESNTGVGDAIDFAVMGDKFKCPDCGIEIVVNFGKQMLATMSDHQEHLQKIVDAAEETVRILRIFPETLKGVPNER